MRHLRNLLVVVLAAAAAAPAQASASDMSDVTAVGQLNAWRAESGLAPVALDPALSHACRLHIAYLQRNGLSPGHDAHYEDPSLPGYTEAGAAAGRGSVISAGSGQAAMGPRQFERAMLHRGALLNPRLVRTGWASDDTWVCMTTSATDNAEANRAPALTVHPSPRDGATDVPVEFAGGEHPDPREAVPGRPAIIGWMLSLQLNGPWAFPGATELTTGTLTPDGAPPVPVVGQDSDDRFAVRGGLSLLPFRPLTPATWYTARAAGVQRGRADDGTELVFPFDVSWRFRTSPRAAFTGRHWDVWMSGSLSRAGRLSVRIKGGGRVPSRELRDRELSVTVETRRARCRDRCEYRRLTTRALRFSSRGSATLMMRLPRTVGAARVKVTVPGFDALDTAWRTASASETFRPR